MESAAPGELVHVDEKLGKIPADGGWAHAGAHSRGITTLLRIEAGTVNASTGSALRRGRLPLPALTAIDAHLSRMVYSELLTDERKETAAAFWSTRRRLVYRMWHRLRERY